jgi:hypothetical protein
MKFKEIRYKLRLIGCIAKRMWYAKSLRLTFKVRHGMGGLKSILIEFPLVRKKNNDLHDDEKQEVITYN